jgi:cell volume regulation protein A
VTVEQLDQALLIGSAVLLVTVVAIRISDRSGLPSLLIYLGLGLLIGQFAPDFVDDPEVVRTLGYVALVIILAEGGLTTRWVHVRPAIAPAAVLATVGVVVSIVVTAAIAKLVLDVEWRLALIVGAVVTSTDAAAVFSVLRKIRLPRRLSGLLEAESGFNDAPVVLIVVALSESSQIDSWELFGLTLLELAGGAVVGIGVGAAGGWMLRRVALPAAGVYPLAVVGLCVLAYGGAAVLELSGFLATYVAGLVIGNFRLPHQSSVRGFVDGIAWLAQIGLFVLLGLLVAPVSDLSGDVLPAIAIGLGLTLAARPLSVLVCLTPFRYSWREQTLVSWAGLRGAVPIVLATIPVAAGVEQGNQVLDVVFVLVVLFTLLQGPTLPWVARRLGLTRGGEPLDLPVETAPLGRLDADVLQVLVPTWSQLHGVEAFELQLPHGANLSLVVRNGEAFVPAPTTRLQHGDELILVVPAHLRDTVERRLRAIARGGRLAGWYGEAGDPA